MSFVKITISADLLSLERRAMQKLAIGKEGAALYSETQIKQQVRAVDAVASKELLNSVRRLPAPANMIRTGSDKIQAQFVEEGRKPGKQPPIAAILAWLPRRGMPADSRIAFLIARKIGAEGFKGRFPFRKAAEIATPGVVRILSRSLEGL